MDGPKQSASFSEIADRYDQSRSLPNTFLEEAYRRLVREGILPPNARVVDIGTGTGQLSFPLVMLGFAVTGIDISHAMLRVAGAKRRPGMKASFVVSDAQSIPIQVESFDVAIASKLFQHVGNWRLAVDEIFRITKAGGHFIHINERGAFVNAVRKRFESLADAWGYRNRYMGVISQSELKDDFRSRGSEVSTVDTDDLRWKKQITYGQALTDFKNRLFAEFWCIPESDYERMIAEVDQWIHAQPSGSDTVEEMHPYLSVDIFTLPK